VPEDRGHRLRGAHQRQAREALRRENPREKADREQNLVFKSGSLIECAGWEQEITGFKHYARRPDRCYLDDVENLERVRSTEAVDASMRKLYSEVMPALDKTRRKIRVTQTPRAADCMVTRLRSNPDWLCASFPIVNGDIDDPKTVSAWPSRYPMEWVRSERDRYERAGMLRQFQQEYLLNVDTTESKPFTEDMLRYMDVAPAAWLPRYAIYDPSRTANAASSARTGKVVVSRMGSKIIVHESRGEFWKPDETRTDVFETFERHHCAEIGIEKDSLDDYLLQPLRFEMIKRGQIVPIRSLNAPHDRDKEAFIMGLQPFFKAGDVVLVGGRGMHAQLVAEVLNFPAGKVDIINALAYSLKMFSGQPLYEDFGEANIGPAPALPAGEKLTTVWNASAAEVVCAAIIRQGRFFYVARDFAAGGPTTDAVRQVLPSCARIFRARPGCLRAGRAARRLAARAARAGDARRARVALARRAHRHRARIPHRFHPHDHPKPAPFDRRQGRDAHLERARRRLQVPDVGLETGRRTRGGRVASDRRGARVRRRLHGARI
jgi:predicted phage terminase large subunit-like protein